MWIAFSLLAAVLDAGKNSFAKHNTKQFDPIIVSWAWSTYSLVALIPLMFVRGIPELDGTFWLAILSRTVLDVMAVILYTRAIKQTDLSLCLPLLALTPVFIIFSGMVIAHEFPNALGIAGVCIIVAIAIAKNRQQFMTVIRPRVGYKLVPVGVTDGLMLVSQSLAQSIGLTALVIALKRTSIVFSSLLGAALFKEDIRGRIVPILVIVSGAMVIGVSQI